jgi:rRNA maturation endonuclease Nob1
MRGYVSPVPHIVKPRPTCRNCGTPVKTLHRCPKCGKRNFAALLATMGAKH